MAELSRREWKEEKSLEINQSFKISEQQDEMTFTFHHHSEFATSINWQQKEYLQFT
jgi:hypothetical protein